MMHMRAMMMTGIVSVAAATLLLLLLVVVVVDAGSIDDVEHIVIYMQENRAYDHYYGTLRGVRGYNDRAATTVSSGKPVWYQPAPADIAPYMLPFHMDTRTTSAMCGAAPCMSWPCDLGCFNQSLMDGWNVARAPGLGMGYFNRSDLPYYYALADGFTMGDQYFQSTFTATDPNRLHLFSGSNGLSVGTWPVMDDESPVPGWNWTTFGETLETAGVSWKVYQEEDNFDDNGFAWFNTFQRSQPGDPLYDKGMKRYSSLLAELGKDVSTGVLPQVSIIVGPANLSEHADYHPAAGEWLTSQVLDVFKSNPAVYEKTVIVFNYDEGGQFFDHQWPPTPPTGPDDGASTVTTVGEMTDKGPIGLGFRVPLMMISPWSRGGYVCSEVFDHTSVLRFVEARWPQAACPNISPWRRAVTGDLTSCLDFDSFDPTWPALPDTSGYIAQAAKECALPAPTVPKVQHLPEQEPGTRPSRATPYSFDVDMTCTSDNVASVTIKAAGKQGAAFVLYNSVSPATVPRKYTVEGGKTLTDKFACDSTRYGYALHGPNGFVRSFNGTDAAAAAAGTVRVRVQYDGSGGDTEDLVVIVANKDPHRDAVFSILNGYDPSQSDEQVKLMAGHTASYTVDIADVGRWYDVRVRVVGAEWRFMGRMENGRPSISDPWWLGEPLNPYTRADSTHPVLKRTVYKTERPAYLPPLPEPRYSIAKDGL